MVVAGDPSGDALAAGLVRALAAALPGARFIGAGGANMAAAGVANSFDLTADAVIGLSDVWQRLAALSPPQAATGATGRRTKAGVDHPR
jgi:lipid-A-disaccharide synthase